MSRKTVSALMLALVVLGTLTLAPNIQPVKAASAQVYFSVEPVAVPPLTSFNGSANGLEIPFSPSPIGEDFTVQIHLRNATTMNVPAGVAGIEMHFYFGDILNYCRPIGFTDMLGQPSGVLLGPSSVILYGINAGFYDDAENPISASPYTNATQYLVQAGSIAGGWNNADGLVAEITFQITSQPSSSQSNFYAPLQITFTDLQDASFNEIPSYTIPGTVQIDATQQVYFSVEPVAVPPLTDINSSINGLEIPFSPSPIGEDFTVQIHLRNATTMNVPAGVAGIEVIFDFRNILNYCRPIGFTDMLGQPGGALLGPPSSLLTTLNSFYDDAGNPISASPYTNATQYMVAAASKAGQWWNADGAVAEITFQITGQPSSPPYFYAPLQITFTVVDDSNANYIPEYVIPGTVQIDVPLPAHDVAITNFLSLKTVFGQGYGGNMTVTAANLGYSPETFNVSVYANTTIIASQNVTLPAGNSTTATFIWNTTGFALGNYTLSAYAWPVPNETNTANNNFTVGTVTVTIPGDINGDFKVSLADLVLLASAYGSKQGDAKWNPNADIDGNGVVGLSDLVILAQHYGQHYP